MNRQKVNSSRISSVGWENNTLEIQFKDFSIYQYHDVDYYEYINFMNASSLGSELSKLDKKHRYNRV